MVVIIIFIKFFYFSIDNNEKIHFIKNKLLSYFSIIDIKLKKVVDILKKRIEIYSYEQVDI